VDVSFFDSTANKRGARSAPISVATKDHASKEKKVGHICLLWFVCFVCIYTCICTPKWIGRLTFDIHIIAYATRQNCVYDPFELKMKKSSKPGMGDKFQIAIVGDYPTRCVYVYEYICVYVHIYVCVEGGVYTVRLQSLTYTHHHHSIRPKQTVKLTFDVVSEQASYLMVNILSKNVRSSRVHLSL
jgi:hypothetical protein